MRLKSLSYEGYLAAKVSPHIARFITASNHPIPHFDILAAPLDWDYSIPVDAADIVPLWSSNADGVCRWRRSGREEYALLSHDSSESWPVAYTEQGLLADLYRRYFESLAWHDEEEDQKRCARFAAYIGFTRQKEADSLLASSYDDFKSWLKKEG